MRDKDWEKNLSKEDAARLKRIREMTRKVLDLITPKPEQVLRMRFSATPTAKTLEEIGAAFGVSAKRIQRLKKKYNL